MLTEKSIDQLLALSRRRVEQMHRDEVSQFKPPFRRDVFGPLASVDIKQVSLYASRR